MEDTVPMPNVAEMNFSEALKEHFGFTTFKGQQEEIITSLMNGQDTFVIMPTGGGKSLCYQLPALILPGTAIIISPLIALMKNQVDLVRGYSGNEEIAHFLNSSLNKTQAKQVKEDIVDGKTKLLYVAPETLKKEENLAFFRSINVSFVAIDEAHCISEWGHDFRPEYRRIREMVEAIKSNIPLIALTATATPKVKIDIVKNLALKNPKVFISSFNRSNLFYEVRPKGKEENVLKDIVHFIKNNAGKSGIIYCLNRKTTEKLAQLLSVNDIKASAYHAGMDASARSKIQDDFLMEEIDVICATIAFGMGIDKPDVRFVIHYNVPKSIENYFQETGRAGRDGLEGICITYFSYADITKLEKFLKDKSVQEREISAQLINEVEAFACTSDCRRLFLLHYFGEDWDAKGCNCMCDNCKNPKQKEELKNDLVIALNSVIETKEKFKIKHLVSFIMGKKTQDITAYKHDKMASFGAGKDKDAHHWNSILRQAILKDFLRKDIEDYGVIKFTEKAQRFLKNPVSIKFAINHDFDKIAHSADAKMMSNGKALLDDTLFNLLKDLRRDVARKHNVPPFVIFQDPSLEDMATRYPITLEEFGHITGVSKGKALKYGEAFSETIKNYVEEYEIDRPTDMVIKSEAKKSKKKVQLIMGIDKKIPLHELAESNNLTMHQLITELESIVGSGTKINIDYYIETLVDEELIDDVIDYFKTAETDSTDALFEEFSEDEVEQEALQMIRVKFLSDFAN